LFNKSAKTLNGTLGNGCVCGAAAAKGIIVIITPNLHNNGKFFAMQDKPAMRQHKAVVQLVPKY
jgi:hypothetical protein